MIVGLTAGSFTAAPSTEVFLPAVGRISGQGGAEFYTTVWATNLTGVPETFTFRFLKQGQANASPASFSDTLAPGETKIYENVVQTKLGLASSLGAARVTSTGEILVAERIYNQAPGADIGDTEGLFFAGVPKSFSISLGQSASIQGINQGGSENFRYNFALVETGGGSQTVNIQVFDGGADGLDAAVSPRGYRLLAKVPRLPTTVIDRLVDHFGNLQKLLAASADDLLAVDGVGEARAHSVREGLSRLAESSILERYV
jgi:hypothetical protein